MGQVKEQFSRPSTDKMGLAMSAIFCQHWDQAQLALRRVLLHSPQNVEALVNLGYVSERIGKPELAELYYKRALRVSPDLFEAHLNLGVIYEKSRRHVEALLTYEQALKLKPDSPVLWGNFGVLLAGLNQTEAARVCFEEAIELDCDYSRAKANYALLLLRAGEFEEGWKAFEHRDWPIPNAHLFHMPRWKGQALAGKSVLLASEGGIGDMIQFVRFALNLKQAGAAWVSVMAHPSLLRLFEDMPDVDEVISLEEVDALAHSHWDFWVPALSLPKQFACTLKNMSPTIPYLYSNPLMTQRMGYRMKRDHTRKAIGLVWRGNPDFENDSARSMRAADMLGLTKGWAKYQFYSLQKEMPRADEQSLAQTPEVCPMGENLHDFSDTAAALLNLDLLVTVDTAVAHLAGALGVPCWVLLPSYKSDWRWLTDRIDSPWYPGSMRLFRQKEGQSWQSLVEEVASHIR